MKTLGKLLQEIDRHHWQSSLFVEADVQLTPSIRAQVAETDRYTQEPLEPVDPALRRLLSVQESSATHFQYYVSKDAFIDFAAKRAASPRN